MRFKDICAWLFDGQAYRLKAEAIAALKAREITSKALCAAKLAGDTRSVGACQRAHKAATDRALAAELAWRRVQPRRPSRAAKRTLAAGGSR